MNNFSNNPTDLCRSGKAKKIAVEKAVYSASPVANQVPSANILDLRSMMAQKEAIEARQKAPHASKKKTSNQFLQKFNFFCQSTSESVPKLMPAVEKFEPQPVTPMPATHSHLSFWAVGRSLLAFIILSLLFIVPAGVSATWQQTSDLQKVVTASAETAFDHLQKGGESMKQFNFNGARDEFRLALNSFAVAGQDIQQINEVILTVAKYIPGKGQTLYAGQQLLSAGEQLAAAGENVANALEILNELQMASALSTSALTNLPPMVSEPSTSFSSKSSANQPLKITDTLVLLHSALLPATERIDQAVQYLTKVTPADIPAERRDLVVRAQTELPQIQTSLTQARDMTEMLLALLGHEQKKRYLVLFQNNHELRPTGGFIGSLALIAMEKGHITDLDVPAGGVYDVSGQFTKKIIAPAPLQLVNPHWNLQDANWFSHFPASAQKIQWFYERSKGQAVDGVITVVPRVVEQLLAQTGPIDLNTEFGVTITAENFYQEVQRRAEEKFDTTTESKKIIGVLLPRILDNLAEQSQQPQQLVNIVTIFKDALARKDILFYMNDPLLQQQFSHFDWTGEIKNTNRDYLAVVHANIAGGKTDNVMSDVIKHKTAIGKDGEIIDTVTIIRQHQGEGGDEFTGVNNVDYVRLYVPAGSELLTATGFKTPLAEMFLRPDGDAVYDADLAAISGDILRSEQTGVAINTEFNKLVIGGWIQTPVGGSSVVQVSYRLPFKLEVGGVWRKSDHYSLLVQKQPGSFDSIFMQETKWPENIVLSHSYPDEQLQEQKIIFTQDFYTGFVVSERQ